MKELSSEIHVLLNSAAQNIVLAADEYIDPADGLIHCKSCGGQRQAVVPIPGSAECSLLGASAPVRRSQSSTAGRLKNSGNVLSASGAGVSKACKTVTYTITPLPTTMGKIH